MKSERPIHYEPHPVSPERKAELIAQGFRIVDAKFAPPAAKAESNGPEEVRITNTFEFVGEVDARAVEQIAAAAVKPRGKPGPKPKSKG